MVHSSLQYWHHRRATTRLPRIRRSSETKTAQPLANILAFKVGMTHVMMTDDRNGPSKNMEIMRPCTVLEVPRMEVYGIRAYAPDQFSNYEMAKAEILHRATAQKLKIKNIKKDEAKISELKAKAKEFTSISVLVASHPKEINAEQNHPMRFEFPVAGKDAEEQLANAEKMLGKELKAQELFKNGEYIDVTSISTGKGWAGVIKRHHTTLQYRKATQKRRHSAHLGSMGDHKVRFSVPHAGQMGYNYRTEHNKRILKIGAKTDAETFNVSGGFRGYGPISGDFVVLDGSIPGPAKRIVRIRKSIRSRNEAGIKEPKITYVAK